MNESTLYHVFQKIIGLSLISSSALTMSCSGTSPGSMTPLSDGAIDTDASPIDESKFTLPQCTSTGALTLAGLKPSMNVDYLEFRQGLYESFTKTGTEHRTVLDHLGSQCATATNVTTCKNAFERLTSSKGFREMYQGYGVYYLATTAKDTVATVASNDELKTFLGPIDSSQEAVFLAWAAGYNLDCKDVKKGGVRSVVNGYEVIATKGGACGPDDDVKRFLLHVKPDGTITELYSEVLQKTNPNCAIGRRPDGLCDSQLAQASTSVGQFFAEAAYLEEASVTAFRRLYKELVAYKAPKELLRLAKRSARDEIQHTRITKRLARKYGGVPKRPTIQKHASRSLEDFARENLVEGCVRETYGALQALWQAHHAQDLEVKHAMVRIARDETRHAFLSHKIARWVMHKLDLATRKRLMQAQHEAITQLRSELAYEPDQDVRRCAGLPQATQAQVLLNQLHAHIWA